MYLTLYRYLVDKYELKCPEITFRHFIKTNKEFNDYFIKFTRPGKNLPSLMFETPPGKHAQIDWKESQKFILKNGEEIIINIFVYILSYSRFRVYFLSIDKTRPILLDFLTRAFELTGGVPSKIITDNMP